MELAVFSSPTSPCLFKQNIQTALLPFRESRTRRCSRKNQQNLASMKIFSKKSVEFQANQRRSANYHSSIWDPKVIQSLSTPYNTNNEIHASLLKEMKAKAKRLLKSTQDEGTKLKLIDAIQRLGLAYHFEKEIEEILCHVNPDVTHRDLYTTALLFRLLRNHGSPVTTDVFNNFRGGDGRFMECLSQDMAGLLSLYEASHLGINGEDVLEEAQNFSIRNLKLSMETMERKLAKQVQESLETPLHWRIPRLEARNFIDVYQSDDTNSIILLQFAKLDYNLVQALHQSELKELSGWWQDLDFKTKLSFSRDRLMENYLWSVGIISEPQFSKCRMGLTKFICILTAIDDLYDVYGFLDELESFTRAVTRWDTNDMEDLPEYMKICIDAMVNFAYELVDDVQKSRGLNVLPYIKEEWANLCNSYLVEAKWFNRGYTPTPNKYLENAWISVGFPAAMVHICTLLLESNDITENHLRSLNTSQLIYRSSVIGRLSDDLGTQMVESERGDVKKWMQCYMEEEGVMEEEAREHVKGLIRYSWKKLNEESVKTSLPILLVNSTLNMARAAHCIFQHGDGIGTSTGLTRDRLISLFAAPVCLKLFE